MQEDRSQTGSPGEDAGPSTGPEAEETQRLIDLLGKIREEFSQSYVGDKNAPNQETVDNAKHNLSKTRARLRHQDIQDTGLSEGEKRSSQIDDVAAIAMKDIRIDREFQNTRLYEDAFRPDATNSEGQRLSDLKKSMEHDGQKTPIVVAMGPDKKFLLRAGFRRFKCAKELNWEKIRAIVLPGWVRQEDEYWFNILENTARKSLTTFEAAYAAKLMRDKFGIKQGVFAQKTGYSYAHVSRLLSCIDRLPEELVEQWRNGGGLSFDQWYTLSNLDPHNAINCFRRWTGLPSLSEIDRLKRLRDRKRKRAPAKFLDRMQALLSALQGIDVPKEQRIIYQRLVEYCMGERDDVPGLYDPKKRSEYEYRRTIRTRMESFIPEPTDLKPGNEIPKLEYDESRSKRH